MKKDRKKSEIMVKVLDFSEHEPRILEYINAKRGRPAGVELDAKGITEKVRENYTEAISASLHGMEKLGYVETPVGVFMIDSEGIVAEYPLSEENPWEVYFAGHSEGSIAMFPEMYITLMSGDTVKTIPVLKEEPLEEFIRSFGSRLESNYHIALRHLSEMVTEPEKV